jgi:RecA-family ATPase
VTDVQKQAAQLLGQITDAAERERWLAQLKLMAVQQAPDEAFEPPIRTLEQYLNDPITIPPTLVSPDHLVRGGLNAMIGRSGKGKTVFCLNRALRWAAGLPLFDEWKDSKGEHVMAPLDGPLKGLIVENEGAAGMFHRQIGIMAHASGYLTPEQQKLAKQNLFIWGEGGYSGLKLDEDAKVEELRRGVEKWRPDFIFIEPFRSLWSGEENSATDMSVVVDALINIAATYECAIQIAHHEKKGGHGEDDKMSAARGSTVLENFVTVMEHFEEAKGGEYREWSASKSRHAPAPNPCRVQWDADAWWYKHVPQDAILESIVSALRGNADEPMSITELHEATDEKKEKLRQVANAAVKDGVLKKAPSVSDGNGSSGVRYRLPSGGNDSGGGLRI